MNKNGLMPPVLTGAALKWIAVITMLIDHIGAVVLEKGAVYAYKHQLAGALDYDSIHFVLQVDIWLRRVGRIAFPIFCFLLLEGFFHTSDRKKYAMRLLLFALISEIPFDLAFRYQILEFTYQNVLFTLLIGLLTIWTMDVLRRKHAALALLPAGAGILAGYFMQTDYNWKGVLLILVLYLFYQYPAEKTAAGCLCLLWEPVACLAFLFLNLYNGKKGRSIKFFFYWFYPAHLLVLVTIRKILFF